MVCCFAVGGWQLLKPALRPSAAVASTGSARPWTTRAIEDVKVGDLVLARDEHGAEIGWKPVKEVYRRTSKHLRHLTFRDASGKEQRFETTDEHPFWSVTAKMFVNAGDLKTGDQVTSAPPHQGNPDLDHPSAIQTLTSTHRDEHPKGSPSTTSRSKTSTPTSSPHMEPLGHRFWYITQVTRTTESPLLIRYLMLPSNTWGLATETWETGDTYPPMECGSSVWGLTNSKTQTTSMSTSKLTTTLTD